jgi:hypothetical protein
VTRIVSPKLVGLTFATNPTGRTLTLNGNAFTAPRTWTSWEGWDVAVDAPNQGNDAFASWSDGGGHAHTIRTPAAAASYTASFVPGSATVNDATVGTTPGTFAYAGTWRTSTGTGKYAGDDHYSSTTGSSFTFRFSGTQVALYGAKASHHGQASVQIDGGTAVTIDQYAATRQENVLVYQSPVLVSGAHTVTVTVRGTRQSASTGNVVAIDRAVYGTPPLTTFNDARVGTALGTFAYAGTWRTSTGTGKYLGDDHYSSTTGSSFTLRFSGTRVELYAARASHHGQASVQIDGGTAVTIDQYAATRQENVLVYRSPVLSFGDHAVTVTVRGTRQSASTGYVIAVDRAVSTG